MSKRIYILGILLLFVAAVSSCRYNELEPDQHSATRPAGNKIAFELGTAQSVVPQTKGFAGEQQGAKSFLCMEGSDSIYLACSVTDNNDPVFAPAAPVVKGAPVTTENMTEFYVTANLSPERQYFPITRVDASDKSDGIYTLDYYWPQDQLDFFAANFSPRLTSEPIVAGHDQQQVMTRASVINYNYSSVSWEENLVYFGYDGEGNPCGHFSYSLPEPDVTLKADALSQPDLAFAIAPRVSEVDLIESNDGVVPLRFAHCFSAVTFKLGSEFMDPVGRCVKSVEILNVPSHGVCAFSADQNGDMVFDWDVQEADYKSYVQQIPQQPDGSTNVPEFGIINDGEMTFMLIPHEINEDAKIRVTFELHSDRPEYAHEMVIEKDIRSLFAEPDPKVWRAGKKYIYTLLSEEKVDIEVTDEFVSSEPMVKGNLEITNRGNAPVYVRAYIVGWWENEAGDIVSPWLSTDGTWGGASWEAGSSKWIIAEDGFFYYTDQLQPGETAEKLFDTYTLNTTIPPVVGARLVLNIATQAVVHYYVDDENIWPGVIRTNGPSTQSEGYVYDSLSWK